MSSKVIVSIGVIIGSVIGGYIPMLWGESSFSMSSIIFSGIGGFAGLYLGLKLSNN